MFNKNVKNSGVNMESVNNSTNSPNRFATRSVRNVPYQMLDAGPVVPGCGSLRSQQQVELAAKMAEKALQNRHQLTAGEAQELHEVATILSSSSQTCDYVSRSASGLERSVIVRPLGRGYFVLSEDGDVDYEFVRGSFKQRVWATGVDGNTGLWSKYAVLITKEHHGTHGEILTRLFDGAATGALNENNLAFRMHASPSKNAEYIDEASVEVCAWTENMHGQDELVIALVKEPKMPLDRLLADPEFSISDCLIPYRDAARGLSLMHRGGLVHRDVSPDNILVTLSNDSRVIRGQIADFGTVGKAGERFAALTKVYYNMNDLLVQKGVYHPHDDIHALGRCLLELIRSRHLSWDVKDQLDSLARVLTQRDATLRLSADQVAKRLDLIINSLESDEDSETADEEFEILSCPQVGQKRSGTNAGELPTSDSANNSGTFSFERGEGSSTGQVNGENRKGTPHTGLLLDDSDGEPGPTRNKGILEFSSSSEEEGEMDFIRLD